MENREWRMKKYLSGFHPFSILHSSFFIFSQRTRTGMAPKYPVPTLLVLLLLPTLVDADDVAATACFLRPKDQAEIPARERGQLKRILVGPGDEVSEAQLLAALEDSEAQLAVKLAEIDLHMAIKRDAEGVSVQTAKAALDEAQQATSYALREEQISRTQAESDIAVRQAQATSRLAEDALDRAMESQKKFASSVPSREMETLKTDVVRASMEIEQARYDQSLLKLRTGSATVLVEQRRAAGRRLSLALQDAKLEQQIGTLTVEQMRVSNDLAKVRLERHRLVSPLNGVVTEKLKNAGEWVEIGESVLRVIQLDTLYVEGFAAADRVDGSDRGSEVTVTCQTRAGSVRVSGRLIFVSPEVDPVQGQVVVRAEIPNDDRLLRPGQSVEMVVHGK